MTIVAVGQGSDPNGIALSQSSKVHDIPKDWVLLDNESTVDMFCNGGLLENIRESEVAMHVHCNAGKRIVKEVGDLKGYGTVWYDRFAIANILSLKNLIARFHVSYDSSSGSGFVVTKPDGSSFAFKMSEHGLHYLDMKVHKSGTVLVNTVEGNRSSYSIAHYRQAVAARKLQIKIGRPSSSDFINIVRNNLLPNCPITVEDIKTAEDIFGTDIGCLQGKTTRRRPHQARIDMVDRLPTEVMARYKNITLCCDVMFINKIPFLITISRNLKFGTVDVMVNQKGETLVEHIRKVKQVYVQAGFNINMAMMDGEFEKIRGDLATLEMGLNITARDEHVGDIERYIRTVKERVRGTYNNLAFKLIPHTLVVQMVKSTVFWLNSFPAATGISTTTSPRTIMTGLNINHDRHCQFEFGEYVHTHEPHNNNMAPRTIGAIALRPTGNDQGSFYFYSISTGRIISRIRATAIPMPDNVIDSIHRLA